jgi:hypothetical protein
MLMLVILMTGFTCAANAQREPGWQKAGQKFFEAQLAEIKSALKLNEQTEAKVEATLRNYNMELEKARRIEFMVRHLKRDSISDITAERIILGQINSGKRFLQIREKYYYELKKIISPKEILEIYRIEQDVNRKVMIEFNKRKE